MPGLTYDVAKAEVANRPLTNGEIGCYASHFSLWRQLLEDDSADQYLILEDDVIVDWNFIERLVTTQFASLGVDYLRLYALRPGRMHLKEERFYEGRHLIELRDRAYGSQAYIITRKGARLLVKHCSSIVRPVDDTMDRYWEHGLPNLALFPFPIVEEFGRSIIGPARLQERQWPLILLVRRKLCWSWDKLRRQAWLLRSSIGNVATNSD